MASFKNTPTSATKVHGIKIQIGEMFPRRNNAFMKFTDQDGRVLGQISGQTWSERNKDLNHVVGAMGYRHHMDNAMNTYLHMKNTANSADWNWGAELTMAAAAGLSITGCIDLEQLYVHQFSPTLQHMLSPPESLQGRDMQHSMGEMKR